MKARQVSLRATSVQRSAHATTTPSDLFLNVWPGKQVTNCGFVATLRLYDSLESLSCGDRKVDAISENI